MATARRILAVRTRASAGAVKVKDPGGIKWLRRGDGVAVDFGDGLGGCLGDRAGDGAGAVKVKYPGYGC